VVSIALLKVAGQISSRRPRTRKEEPPGWGGQLFQDGQQVVEGGQAVWMPAGVGLRDFLAVSGDFQGGQSGGVLLDAGEADFADEPLFDEFVVAVPQGNRPACVGQCLYATGQSSAGLA
jgi:hypothetical protein